LTTSEEFDSGECSKEFFEKPDSLKPHEFPEDLILREAKLLESRNIGSSSVNEFLEVHINSSGFVSPFMVVFSLADVSNSWTIETRGIMGKLVIREQ